MLFLIYALRVYAVASYHVPYLVHRHGHNQRRHLDKHYDSYFFFLHPSSLDLDLHLKRVHGPFSSHDQLIVRLGLVDPDEHAFDL